MPGCGIGVVVSASGLYPASTGSIPVSRTKGAGFQCPVKCPPLLDRQGNERPVNDRRGLDPPRINRRGNSPSFIFKEEVCRVLKM